MAEENKKSRDAFRTISEVAEELGVQQHVLRFWETKFSSIKPMKRGGGRRYYRPEDVALIKKIHHLLYSDGYTIKGVQKLLKGVSKNAVLQEQRAAQPAQAFGANLPQVKPASVPRAAAVEQQSAIQFTDQQKKTLRSLLDDLKEMRGMIDGESSEAA